VILLDTHVALMLALDPERLSRSAARAIARAEASNGLAIASITLWEIALLAQRGEIVVPGSVEAFLRELCQRPGISVLDLSPEVAAVSTQFPPDFPRDPADRIIGATARVQGLALVTKDQRMQDSPLLRTIW
jgi:PIN domain nuclease of toxin-antitoxin system